MTSNSADGARPAVFLDRDGTIMHDVDYCGDPAAVRVYDGVPEAMRRLKDHGFKLIVITNQSGIGRGYFTVGEYRTVEDEVSRQVGKDVLDGTYFCPDVPSAESVCRKPSPDMVIRAARDHQIDLSRSYFVGDKAIDVQCGRNAGLRTVLVRTGYGADQVDCRPDLIAKDLPEAAEMILGHS